MPLVIELTPAREALQKAISTHAGHIARVGALESAYENATQAWRDARSAVSAAEEALETAPRRATELLVARALNGGGGGGAPGAISAPALIAEAEAALTAARQDADAHAAAREEIERQHAQAERAISNTHELSSAAMAVIADEVGTYAQQLLIDCAKLQHALVDKLYVLDWLCRLKRIPIPTPPGGESASTVSSRLYNQGHGWFPHGTASPSLQAWEAALRELQKDAAAELPSGAL
jgi:hypothetical protein